jgi:transposase
VPPNSGLLGQRLGPLLPSRTGGSVGRPADRGPVCIGCPWTRAIHDGRIVHGCANAGSPTRRSDRAARSTSATAARALPRGRNVVERRFNKLKQWRGIAMRVDTDKTPAPTTPASSWPPRSTGSLAVYQHALTHHISRLLGLVYTAAYRNPVMAQTASTCVRRTPSNSEASSRTHLMHVGRTPGSA